MALPSITAVARRAAEAAVNVTVAGVGVTAGLVAGTAKVGTGTAVAVAGGSMRLARSVAVEGVRFAGTAVTGSDPLADGRPERVAEAARALFEPSEERHHRRVWVDGGHAHVELAEPAVEGGDEVRRTLRRQLERLEGVEWATVNDVVGRVLVSFDQRRIRLEDVLGVVTAIEQARGGQHVFPRHDEHPADLEPLLAALVTAAVDTAAIGVAFAGKVLPVPALTRHATLLLALLDQQRWLTDRITARIGPTGTDLVFTGASALLHALTQSPTVPALNAAAAYERALEVLARRSVWRRREPELCRPDLVAESGEPIPPPGERPVPLPPGPIESYKSTLSPTSLAAAAGLLALTREPGRSADLLKALTPRGATLARESFASVLDLLMCRRGVLPMDGSAFRRLDRIDTVVLDGGALCTGPPIVVRATAEAEGRDDQAIWATAARLLGGSDRRGDVRLGPPEPSPDAPGGEIRAVLDGDQRLGTAVVAPEPDPHAEALVKAATSAGHRVVLTEHAGTHEIAGLADEVAPTGEPLVDTVRRLQGEGRGVLVVSVADGPALMAADVGVASVRTDSAPAWGADLVTGPGLADACRVVSATEQAREISRRAVNGAITGNVLGALLAAVGDPRRGQEEAVTPGKLATAVLMARGAWEAVRLDAQPPPPATVHTPWHALDPEQVLSRLGDRPREADGRRGLLLPLVSGLPVVRWPARFGRTVASELNDPLTPILGTGAVATAILGEITDAVLVGGVVVGNALISSMQRMRAETALESLLLQQEVVAHREVDGRREDVPATALRVGDVLLVEAGDVVPADARLLEVSDLEVDESSLTGESLSATKSPEPTPGADVADRTCMLFDGTTVVAGTGRAVVVATGDATQAGRAATAAGTAPPPAGVQARLGELTRAVLPVTLAGGALVAGLGVLWRRPLREAVGAGVAVAVAAVPEGLPLVATVAQMAAARRLSRRGTVVRSARVLEALGRVDTVCFDKTGTLTENRLRVVRLVPVGRDGGVGEDGLLRLAASAVGSGDEQAHETDRAVVEAAAEHGVLASDEPETSLPFGTGRGFSAAVRDGHLVVKGAPEVVLRRCTRAGAAQERAQKLAAEGLRVLAVAEREIGQVPDDLDEAARKLTLRGFVALADTVRGSTVAAVEQLRAAGIRVVVATGDHPETASAIAAQAGVPGADRVVTGAQLARASEAERAEMVRDAAVFARLSPEQKLTLVAALRRAGATLAMTGDGINDAAAIRLADVGIAVTSTESPAARKAADVVLTDIDLTRLVDAIAEGRAMWSRVRDAVSVLVGGNAGEVAFTVLGTAFGGRSPLGTRQLLLVNMLTDMFPALAVAVSSRRGASGNGEGGPLAGHPLRDVLLAGPHRGFTRSVRQMVLVRGAATAAGATGAWAAGSLTRSERRASTMGLAALITSQLGQTAWAGRHSPLVLATAAGSLVALAAVVQTPGLSRFFGCTPLDPLSWLVVLGWAGAATAGAEVVPRVLRASRNRGGAPRALPVPRAADR
ncbi:cation-translocating P-type ATPase [Pseudonocardia sp. DSM 110487]|uniref:cation-translocating P-type ATPase n=1 Tax=Pseudonocardia sp. DSM 110487 TaxID=2865833 RepID=UPI001C695EC6|nr:HAD-IC family P-type ATPase [Pseudonocardia sp. DSM 110487]QYN32535.1 cation-translocating P-type ATPase [Pseudonocardia sp. DSM 110487]